MNAGDRPATSLHLTFASSPLAVRDALHHVTSFLARHGLSDIDRGTAELVLAEVVNNIVEHACAGNSGDTVDLRVTLGDSAINCIVRDNGLPMPDNAMPRAQHHALAVNCADLPEGGFGWMLIREHVRDLHYQRADGANRLSFSVPAGR